MGTAVGTCQESVDYLNEKGYKAGVIEVKLFRPWPHDYFIKKLPKSIKKICVLDRTREDGSNNPLFLDVVSSIAENGLGIKVIGG